MIGCKLKITINKMKTAVLIFIVAVYPLIVIPGPLDYFRGPRYIMLALTSLLALIVFIFIKNKSNINHPAYIPLGVFILLSFTSTFFAGNITMAWIGSPWRFTGFSTYLYCLFLFLLATQQKNIKIIIQPMIICSAIVSFIGLMQYLGLNFIPHEYFSSGDSVAYSTMGHMNWFGTYTVFVIPASIITYLEDKRKVWLVTSMFMYSGLLVSLTRGVWLTFLLTMLFIMVVFYRDKNVVRLLIIIIIIFVMITVVLAPVDGWRLLNRIHTVPNAVASTASLIDESIKSEGSVFERLYIWQEAINLVNANWLFGIGHDHLRIEMPNGRIEDKAHNIYLEIAVSTGIFALASYLVFLSFFLRRQNSIKGVILITMIFSYLTQGFVNNDVIQIIPIFWVALGLSLACSAQDTQDKSKPVSNN